MDLAWPGQDSLLSAVRGHHVGRHPLTRFAYELGVIHAALLDSTPSSAVHFRRRGLVVEIDRWLDARLPTPHPRARLTTWTVGALIDRIAAVQVRAYRLLMTRAADDPLVHDSWTQLAKLIDTYNDMVTGIDRRMYRLPSLPQSPSTLNHRPPAIGPHNTA
ncbi:DUF4254 domain-containing protein [Nocardia cyriacigeorgica]|uniref:DUF4254 domain-containing protein n=1 Tax=Nocardia cyriacigeorgica TaxID=135487 RepID=A0A5R8NPC9_9NOCA|nr:DUF4254 domain-containing protein [Nocardia cyriacigeorgica]TLF77550.1 DUF4254 domain-containing protein [Nocardia cyriacigeorgica]